MNSENKDNNAAKGRRATRVPRIAEDSIKTAPTRSESGVGASRVSGQNHNAYAAKNNEASSATVTQNAVNTTDGAAYIRKNTVNTELMCDMRPRKSRKKNRALTIVGRTFLVILTVILLLVFAVYSICFAIARGPSPTVRDKLVLSALQASATKWAPGLFLPGKTVDEILENSKKVNKDTISIDDVPTTDDKDEWENAVDGMRFITFQKPNFKAYMLIVKDPKRVMVGVQDSFTSYSGNKNIFGLADKYNAVAAINGGEFPDNGVTTLANPVGVTYSAGKMVWSDGNNQRTFIGLDKNDKLVVREGITPAKAEELGIRDGVCFQTGNTLITHDGDDVTVYYEHGNTGTAQRTAIGQRADGAIILLVTDGRSAASIGATHNDVIDIMLEYGAITAAMLDGGSSTTMFYRDYYTKYNYDMSTLDQYQVKGLVNKYKAFTQPRRIPTYFIVVD